MCSKYCIFAKHCMFNLFTVQATDYRFLGRIKCLAHSNRPESTILQNLRTVKDDRGKAKGRYSAPGLRVCLTPWLMILKSQEQPHSEPPPITVLYMGRKSSSIGNCCLGVRTSEKFLRLRIQFHLLYVRPYETW